MVSSVVAIQARMSSKRFPGKVLASLQGRTVIEHVINCFRSMGLPCFVLTSLEPSDDILVNFLEGQGQDVFRGPLDDVLSRFQSFAKLFPASHIIRVSADSPLLHPEVVSGVLSKAKELSFDITTNVFPRTFPRGQSVEILQTEMLETLNYYPLSSAHREHVTAFIYENPDFFRISNLYNSQNLSSINMCVDNPDDLVRLENLLAHLDVSISDGLPPWRDFSYLIESWS